MRGVIRFSFGILDGFYLDLEAQSEASPESPNWFYPNTTRRLKTITSYITLCA